MNEGGGEMKHETETHVFRARLDDSGRIVLPAELRTELGVRRGDELLIVRDAAGVHVETPAQASAAMRAYYKSLIPADVSLADELIAERRAEAERE